MKIRKRLCVSAFMLVLAGVLLGGPEAARAASGLKKDIAVIFEGNAGETVKETVSDIDWDGDKAADELTLAVKRTGEDANGAIQKITVKLNKKTVWSKTFSQPYDYTAKFDYLAPSSVGAMLHVRTIGDNDWSSFEQILYLNPKTGKFEEALDLLGLAQSTSIKKVTSKTVTITCEEQPDLIGRVRYSLKFKWKSGKLALVSKKVKATSLLYRMQPTDKYTRLAKKNQFKVKKKKLTFYNSPTSRKKAFTVKKGKKVTLKKIYVMKSWQCALQFSYKGKTGWLKNTAADWFDEPQYNTFCGVKDHLAG